MKANGDACMNEMDETSHARVAPLHHVLVNDAARDAVIAAGARDFIALPTVDDPALVNLRSVLEAGWREMEPHGSGHAGMWPDLFEAGAALVKSQFPQFPGDAVEARSSTHSLTHSVYTVGHRW